jgi:hypothetical protein
MPTLEEEKRAWLNKMGVLLSTRGMDMELATVLPDEASGISKWRGGTWAKLVEHVRSFETKLGTGSLDIDQASAALSDVQAARSDIAVWVGKHEEGALKQKAKGKIDDTTRKYDQAVSLDAVLKADEQMLKGWIPSMREAQSIAMGLLPIATALDPHVQDTSWLTAPIDLPTVGGCGQAVALLKQRYNQLFQWAQAAPLGESLDHYERVCAVFRERILLLNEVEIYRPVISAWPLTRLWLLREPREDERTFHKVPETFGSAEEMKTALGKLRARAIALPQLDQPVRGILAGINSLIDKIALGQTRVKTLKAGDDLEQITALAVEAIAIEVDGVDHDLVFRESNPRTQVLKRVVDLSDTSEAESKMTALIEDLKTSTASFALPEAPGPDGPPLQDDEASATLAQYITLGTQAMLHALANIPAGVRALIATAIETNSDDAVRRGVVADLVALQWVVPQFTMALYRPARVAYMEAKKQDTLDGRDRTNPSPTTQAAHERMQSIEGLQALLQGIANQTLGKRSARLAPEAKRAAEKGMTDWGTATEKLITELSAIDEDDPDIDFDDEVIDDMVNEGLLPPRR